MKVGFIAITAILALTVSVSAMAVDTKNYPGTNCTYENYKGPMKKSGTKFCGNGNVLYVVCPILRDTDKSMSVTLNVREPLPSNPKLIYRPDDTGGVVPIAMSYVSPLSDDRFIYHFDNKSVPADAAVALYIQLGPSQYNCIEGYEVIENE